MTSEAGSERAVLAKQASHYPRAADEAYFHSLPMQHITAYELRLQWCYLWG